MKKIINFLKNKYYVKFIIYILGFAGIAAVLFYLDMTIQNTRFSEIFVFKQAFLSTMR